MVSPWPQWGTKGGAGGGASRPPDGAGLGLGSTVGMGPWSWPWALQAADETGRDGRASQR